MPAGPKTPTRGALLDLNFDLAVFEFAGLELLAELFAGACAFGFGFVIVECAWTVRRAAADRAGDASTCAEAGSVTASVISSRTMAMEESSRSRIMESTSRP